MDGDIIKSNAKSRQKVPFNRNASLRRLQDKHSSRLTKMCTFWGGDEAFRWLAITFFSNHCFYVCASLYASLTQLMMKYLTAKRNGLDRSQAFLGPRELNYSFVQPFFDTPP